MNSATQPLHSGTYDRLHWLSAGQFKAATRQSAEEPIRLLIVSDEHLRVSAWRKALFGQSYEVTEQMHPFNVSQFIHCNYDVVVVDVAAAQLIQVLATIRATESHIPVFVDASRLPNDLSCAGVLPKFRAMPCVRADLLHLINQYCKPADKLAPLRGLL